MLYLFSANTSQCLLGQAVSSNSYTGNNLSSEQLWVCVITIKATLNNLLIIIIFYIISYIHKDRCHSLEKYTYCIIMCVCLCILYIYIHINMYILLHCIWPIILSHTSGKHETKRINICKQNSASKLLNCIDAHLKQMRDLLDKACGHGVPGTDPQTK